MKSLRRKINTTTIKGSKLVPITSIEIENFRAIKHCTLDSLSDINILIGKNGSGKSTILEAIYLASAWANSRDPITSANKLEVIARRRTLRGEWSRVKEWLWYNSDTTKNIKITLQWRAHHRHTFILNTNGHIGLTKEPRVPDLETKKLGEFLKPAVLIDDQLTKNPTHIEEKIIPKVFTKRLDKQIVEMIRRGYEPDAEGLTYLPSPRALAIQTKDTTVRIDDLGDGARAAILTALVAVTLTNTAFLLEDPESHQHPKGLAILMDFLLEIAEKHSLQLFITTHSIELIHILSQLAQRHGLNTKIHHITRNHDGTVDTRTLATADIKLLEDLGLDPRFLEIL